MHNGSMTVTPFVIDVPQSDLDDLRARLRATRWPDAAVSDWSQGIPPAALRRVLDYWAEEYDWRAVERHLNTLTHVTVDGIHAVRSWHARCRTLLLVHGWPDSFVRFLRALPPLADRFELVIPSIPGYGFSAQPAEPLGPIGVADRFVDLMSQLGHERFAVHGGDIGTQIADQLGLRHPDRITALHPSVTFLCAACAASTPPSRPRGTAVVEGWRGLGARGGRLLAPAENQTTRPWPPPSTTPPPGSPRGSSRSSRPGATRVSTRSPSTTSPPTSRSTGSRRLRVRPRGTTTTTL